MYAWTSYSQGFGCARVRPCAVRGRGMVQVKLAKSGRWFLSASTQAVLGKDLDPAGRFSASGVDQAFQVEISKKRGRSLFVSLGDLCFGWL